MLLTFLAQINPRLSSSPFSVQLHISQSQNMKLFSSFLAVNSGLEIAKGLKKDVAESLDFFQTVQLRADHLFRDMIAMHRENVPDTDKVISI